MGRKNSTGSVIEKVMEILVKVEEQTLGGDKIGYFGGNEYTLDDFVAMRHVLNRCHKFYNLHTKASYKYICANKEYNALSTIVSDLKNKKNKTERDFIKLEEKSKRLEELRNEMKEKRNNKQFMQEVKLKRELMEMARRKELFDKYGFIDDLDK